MHSKKRDRCGFFLQHTNFELGTRVPLIFHAAGQTAGIKSNSLVESVDVSHQSLKATAAAAARTYFKCVSVHSTSNTHCVS
jgi:arylsulfatase A-like enzyme